jgi:hypothetical protein
MLRVLLPWLQPSRDPVACRRDWLRDPLSHPDLHRMSLRELADLTFVPEDVLPD